MAVSNMYGRVRKPVGFNLIGVFSSILGLCGGEGQPTIDNDCSIWEPVAPPGYTAMGCVVTIGNQAPSNHIVYCLRSDLVTLTTSSECIFCSPSNRQFLSGFSIWRLDNLLGSFSAHASTKSPSVHNSWDLNHLLLWNSHRQNSASKESASGFTFDHDNGGQERSKQSVNPSGWDMVRSSSKATTCYMSTPNFERIWWDKGSDIRRPVSIWRPIARLGYAILGDCISEGLELFILQYHYVIFLVIMSYS